MKNFILLLFTLLFFSTGFSQVILTYKNNSSLPGDTIKTQEIEMISPGNAGSNQVWDFSKMQYTGEKNASYISTQPTKVIEGLSSANVILNDKGYEYFYKTNENISEIIGLNTKGLSVVFSDPILKMKYPVLFGTAFKDEFSGVGLDTHNSDIGISGTYSLEADAYGTIILHDRIIKDVLRIKIEENKIQINPCNIYEIKTTAYFWYAPAARYPVISMSTREVKTNGGNAVITNSASVNQNMIGTGIMLAGSGQDAFNADEVALILYPNPFIEKLNYSYFLRKQMPVSIDLVDMTGKIILTLAKEQVQAEGLHNGDLDAIKHSLPMGMYYFRLKFGDKEIISKVVKM
jgi:hypothetical protein